MNTCQYRRSVYLITPSCIVTKKYNACCYIIDGISIRFSIIKSFKSRDVIYVTFDKVCKLNQSLIYVKNSQAIFVLALKRLSQLNSTLCISRPRAYGSIVRHADFLSNACLAASTALSTSA